MGGKDYEVYEKKLICSVFGHKCNSFDKLYVKRRQRINTVGYYKCTGSDVNIRSGPGTQYTIVGTLNYGTKVYVYSISNGWAKISLGGIYRYVSADYLREL